MKKNQYKRLTFVVFFPLLILGLVLYSYEVLAPNNYLFKCSTERGTCWVSWASSSDKSRVLSSYALILGDPDVVVVDGLATKIIVLETVIGEREEGFVGRPVSLSESGVEKMFVVPGYVSPYSYQGFCSISPFIKNSKAWSYMCSRENANVVYFKFKNKEEERLFEQMFLSLVEQKKLAKRLHKLTYVIILVPLMAYFLLSLMGWILFRLFSYVKGNEH